MHPVKVLVGEDHEHSCDVLVRRLQRMGFNVHPVTSSAELTETVSREDFDVVLLCFSPREHDGWKTASHIKPYTTAPIIAISSVPFNDDRASAIARGCQAYLPKPFNFNDLLTEIRQLTDAASEQNP